MEFALWTEPDGDTLNIKNKLIKITMTSVIHKNAVKISKLYIDRKIPTTATTPMK
jgi:hypothetical protein